MIKEKRGNNVKRSVKFILDFWRHLNPIFRILLVGFILLNLAAFGTIIYLNRQNLPPVEKAQPLKDQSQSAVSPRPRPTKPPLPKDYDLKISDQLAGITLTVDSLAAPKGGWLVVYKSANGKVGELLEEAIPPYEAGTYNDIVFILRTPLTLGQKYFALLHTEDRKEALNSKGEKVMQQFIVK